MASSRLLRVGLPVALIAGFTATLGATATTAAAQIAPVARAVAQSLRPQTAPTVLPSSHIAMNVTVEMCATEGSLTTPAGPVPVWGYVAGDCSTPTPTSAAIAPFTITAAEGDTINVTLHNNLGVMTGLNFPGHSTAPDLVGTATFKTYTLSNVVAGTSIFEAALLKGQPGGTEYQVAMGLVGTLVVTHEPHQAYGPATAFDTDQVVLLSEVDPALNAPSGRSAFDMRSFNPVYSLINGKVSPNTDVISATVGEKLLLRVVNGGVMPHSLATLGLRQHVVGLDGTELRNPRTVIADTVGPGQSSDVIVSIPAGAYSQKFALYDASMRLHNAEAPGVGGMVTFIETGVAAAPGAPVTSAVTVTPGTITTAQSGVTLTAQVSNGAASAGYSIDGGITCPMTVSAGVATAAVYLGSGSCDVPAVAGTYVFSVRASNNAGTGAAATTTLVVEASDVVGPLASAATVSPTFTSATGTIVINAAISDVTTGGSDVFAAEYFMDTLGSVPGSGTPMALSGSGQTVSASATEPLAGLTEGLHQVFVRGQDTAGNWGAGAAVAIFTVDSVGPVSTTSVSPVLVGTGGTTTTVTVIDAAGANVTAAEYRLDSSTTTTALGTASPAGSSRVYSASLTGVGDGIHTIEVRGQDEVGNVGDWSPSVTFTVDTVAPVATITSGKANLPALTASVTDTVSNVVAGEYRINGGPAKPMTIPAVGVSVAPTATVAAGSFVAGTNTIEVRGQDAAGNWSVWASTTFTVGTAITSNVTAKENNSDPTLLMERIEAVVTSDGLSNIVAAEGFIDASTATTHTNGSGFVMFAKDGAFNSPTETVYIDVTLASLRALTAGTKYIRIRGRDGLGWGTLNSTTTIITEKTAPVVTLPAAFSTNLSGGQSNSFTVNVIVNDAPLSSGITRAEWFEGAAPALGAGKPMTITVLSASSVSVTTGAIDFVGLNWTPGNHTLYVRARDAMGNWSAVKSVVVTIVYPNLIMNTFDTLGAVAGWTGSLLATSGNTQAGNGKLNVPVSAAGVSGFIQNNAPSAETGYRARFFVNPNNVNTGAGAVGTLPTVDLFRGVSATSGGSTLFALQYRRSSTVANSAAVRLAVTTATGTTFGNWVAIASGAYTSVELSWQSGPTATATLSTGGVLRQTLSGLNTSANTLESVQLGIQGVLPTVAGSMRFDSFFSTAGATFP